MRSNISFSEEYALSWMPYRRSALGVEPPLWSSAATNPFPDAIRSTCFSFGMELSTPSWSYGQAPAATRTLETIVPIIFGQ